MLGGFRWCVKPSFLQDNALIFLLRKIDDPQQYKDKSEWVDFKRVIWHSSFIKLLESIKDISATGYWTNCGDAKQRYIFLIILILAADYEEQ